MFITSLSVRWNHWNFFFLLWNGSTIFIINKIWTLFIIDTVYDRHLINTLKIDTMCAQQGLGSNWDYYYARSFISSSLLPNAHLVTIASWVKFSPKFMSSLAFYSELHDKYHVSLDACCKPRLDEPTNWISGFRICLSDCLVFLQKLMWWLLKIRLP